ncbi:DNA-binding MarR family transcriptional regulator [Pedobacter sp. CAN_A7]|uniref:MarR family winged helix-turn-helix transcriptional regulator n=1 Tax=Pedobacter sp. CAN_A7 TaxID=2787722 RepID=UPI0018C9063D
MYRLRRHLDKWAVSHLAEMNSINFNLTYMPYFMNIGNDGISNLDLVNKIKVTKQGVGKIVKELEKLGLVSTEKSETDARSNMIYLTEEGRKFYDAVREMTNDLTETYIELIGKEEYNQFIDTFIKISEWHEDQD